MTAFWTNLGKNVAAEIEKKAIAAGLKFESRDVGSGLLRICISGQADLVNPFLRANGL